LLSSSITSSPQNHLADLFLDSLDASNQSQLVKTSDIKAKSSFTEILSHNLQQNNGGAVMDGIIHPFDDAGPVIPGGAGPPRRPARSAAEEWIPGFKKRVTMDCSP
jgi:hypothetical protein